MCLLFVASYKVFPQQKTVSDKDNRYSIVIPSGWVYASSKNAFVNVFMSCDTINPSERLTITYSRGIGSLSDAYRNNKNAMKELKKFKLENEGEGELGGEKCKWFVFTMEGDSGAVWRGKQYTIKPNRIYILQYIVPEKRFDVVKDNFENIVFTFKLN